MCHHFSCDISATWMHLVGHVTSLWVTADTDLSGCESPVFHFTAVPVVPMDFPTVTISAPSSTSSQI